MTPKYALDHTHSSRDSIADGTTVKGIASGQLVPVLSDTNPVVVPTGVTADGFPGPPYVALNPLTVKTVS